MHRECRKGGSWQSSGLRDCGLGGEAAALAVCKLYNLDVIGVKNREISVVLALSSRAAKERHYPKLLVCVAGIDSKNYRSSSEK